jgi:glutamyl-Q tRNA(Asp) synthetase
MMPDAEIVYQSERLPLYSEALDRLKEMGLAYPCFCTRSVIAAEIAASTSAPHLGAAAAAGLSDGPIYPGICRSRSMAERERRLSEERHAWRLDVAAALRALPDEALNWREGEAEVRAQPELFGDVVIARKDAPTSYHLAVTVDDAAQGITDVVRGSDLFAATHVHRLLQALLDLPIPIYHHHPLLLGPDGRRLAKRNGAPSIASLRDAGADPNGLAEDLRMGRVPYGYSPSAS